MNFGRISTAECLNVAPPPDSRCSDPAFRLANPSVCPTEPLLIVKPSVALACALGSIQFKAFYIEGNTETDVTADTVFQSSSPTTAVVGAASGNATGLSAGEATISATYLGKTAFAELSVLGDDCCEEESVAMLVVVDRSKSMSQAFNASYTTKLVFAKAAATRFISEVNETKDLIGLMQFTALTNEVLSAPIANKDAVEALVPGITQTSQSTTMFDALTTAVATLAATVADRKVIILISDGEDQDSTYLDESNPIAVMSDFKSSGGIVICLGVRAHDAGYGLLSALATGGFFINAYDGTEVVSLNYLSGLKGYICAGNCNPTGDEIVATGSLNYCAFTNWNVVDGHVDLIGNGFMDLLPGNDLYVDLAGSRSAYKGTMVTKVAIAIETAKQYRLSLKLAGNQRVNAASNTVQLKVFSRNTDGLADPSIAPVPVAATGSGSADIENYDYAVSYQNANGETPLSPVASENNGTFSTFEIDLTATAVPTASVIRWWKRETGTTTWYLIGEGDPTTAPAFTDTLNLAAIAAMVAAGTIDACDQPITSNTTGTPILLLNQVVSINDFQQDFQSFSYTFTAPGDANVFISIQQTATPTGYDATGLLLDSVKFSNATELIDLFEDDFSAENMQYVPPACGTTTSYVVIGNEPSNDVDLIPVMDGNTSPSGEVTSFDDGAGSPVFAWQAFDSDPVSGWSANSPDEFVTPVWLQYQFPAPVLVTGYTIYGVCSTDDCVQSGSNPKSWILQGSNDGAAWTTLDTQSGHNTWPGQSPPLHTVKSFTFSNSTSYSYYRLTVTSIVSIVNPETASINVLQLHNGGVGDPIYGYESFYNCYGEGCLTEPPAAQAEDDNPLPDIESGFVPPQTYSSTKTICATCPTGFVNVGENLFLPYVSFVRDGDASLTGVRGVSPPSRIAQYCMTQGVNYTPHAWSLYGSTNGTTWTLIDEQEGQTWAANQTKCFPITDTTVFTHLKLAITDVSGIADIIPNGSSFTVIGLAASSSSDASQCATETRTSEVSQGDADNLATAAATAAANALLNCVPFWTVTESVTVSCPVGSFGSPVTRSSTITSFVSEGDATTQAIAEATAAAQAALSCDLSNNDEAVTIVDRAAGAGAPATAQSYPSVLNISGRTGLVTKVVVQLNDYSHQLPDDVHMLLLAPDGVTCVELIANCGGTAAITNVDLVLDDAAGSFLPDATIISSGTFKPSQYGVTGNNFYPSPAPQTGYAATLAEFIGLDPNGSWSIWICDDTNGGSGSLGSWDLVITSA